MEPEIIIAPHQTVAALMFIIGIFMAIISTSTIAYLVFTDKAETTPNGEITHTTDILVMLPIVFTLIKVSKVGIVIAIIAVIVSII